MQPQCEELFRSSNAYTQHEPTQPGTIETQQVKPASSKLSCRSLYMGEASLRDRTHGEPSAFGDRSAFGVLPLHGYVATGAESFSVEGSKRLVVHTYEPSACTAQLWSESPQ